MQTCKLGTLFAIALVTVMGASFMTTLPASAWFESHRPTKSEVKKLKKQNLIPTSMKCRNDPSAGNRLKPEVTLKSAPNKGNRAWLVYAYYDKLDWKPGKPGSTKPFTKKYSKRVTAAASGRTFRCSLWVGPKGSLGKVGKVGRWSRTAGSSLSIN